MCSNMKQLRFNFCSRPASCFGRFKQLHCCFSSAIYTIHPPFPFCQGFLSRGETVPRRPPSAFLGRPRAVSGKMVDGRSANLRCFLFLQSRAQLHFIAALSFLHKGKFHISLACKLYKNIPHILYNLLRLPVLCLYVIFKVPSRTQLFERRVEQAIQEKESWLSFRCTRRNQPVLKGVLT